jgi:hypothetical protein
MLRRFVILLALLAGVLVLADRGMAVVSGNAAARQVKLHEGLHEEPKVTFRGFPFVTQAVRGRFGAIDITARDVERGGVTFDRIDAHLEDVKINLSKALRGKVRAVPIREGEATVRLRYADLADYLSTKPGNVRITVRGEQVYVTSTFGVPNVGSVEVEGTPRVTVTAHQVRVVVSNVHVVSGGTRLTAALAAAAAARASFTIPFQGLPFGIEVKSAELTPTALVVKASATGLVIDVR